MRSLLLSSLLALGPTASSQIPDYVPTDGLVAYYPFNGNPNDVSGNNHHAENDGAVLVQDRFGESSAAYSFSGAERIVAPNSVSPVGSEARTINVHFVSYTELPNGNNQYSLQGLFGSGSAAGGKVISSLNIDGQNTNNGHIPRPGHIYFSSGSWNDEAWSEESVSDSMWHMATMVYSGPNTAVQIFVDGQFQDETEPITLDTDLSAFYIGDVPWAVLFFNGIIDDVGVWDRPLNEEEILELYLHESVVYGCVDAVSCNFNPEAHVDDGTCEYGCFNCGPGTVWDESIQLCVGANPSDTDFDGCVGMTDLLDLLSVFGTCNETPWSCGDPLEYQGYDYETVQIGEQCWFAENLRSENYEDGDVIPAGLSDEDWSTTMSGATAVYGEGSSSCNTHSPDGDACDPNWSLVEYGRLYNWYAVNDVRGLCPMGWHVPTDGEFTTMTDGLGGNDVAGNYMKMTYGWNNGGNGTNASGYSGLPGGYRANNGDFTEAGLYGYWWSSSPIASDAWGRYLYFTNESVFSYQNEPQDGFLIRCIQDSE